MSANGSSRGGTLAKTGGVPNPMSKSNERIYSAQQLVQALRSGVSAAKDQLQVLAILDGTATSWPGVNQAIDDLEFLVDMSAQTTNRLEGDARNMEDRVREAENEVFTLKQTLANANQTCEDLRAEAGATSKDNQQLASKFDASSKEASQLKQELWALEKQRADLASEVEKYKQDNEFMEGEINTLRATTSEQAALITSLKADFASRNTDVIHLRQHSAEQKQQVEHLRKQLDGTSGELRQAQNQLEALRSEQQHLEKENNRLNDECSCIGTELSKSMKDGDRLRDWQEVLKKVEADKLREEQDAHSRTRLEAETRGGELEKRVALLSAESSNRDERLKAKTTEAEGLNKHCHILNIQLKDLQKQATTLVAEKAAAIRATEEMRTQIEKLQMQLQQAQVRAMGTEKERAVAESRAREMMGAERTRLIAAADEGKREAAVQKALSEGWSRDLKELQAKLQEEQDKSSSLRTQLDSLLKDEESKKYDNFKSDTANEQMVRDMRQQLSTRDAELKRLRAEAAMTQKRLDKQIESLQRECNESAAEIQRLRRGDGGLPALGPRSLHDELSHLKRMVVNSIPEQHQQQAVDAPGRMAVKLPSTVRGGSTGARQTR